MSPVDPDNWDVVASAINKKYTDGLSFGDNYERGESIPTGSLELDIAMGRGVPQGRWTRLYGDYGCLAPDTKVLTSSCEWIDLGLLNHGDGIIGFDEFPVHNNLTGQGTQRKLRYAEISENPFVILPSYRIITDRDTDTVASDSHLWLVSRRSQNSWITSEKLRIGDRIIWFGDTWPDFLNDTEREMAAYLGGLFDGEGSVDGNRIYLHQNPGVVLDRGLDYMQKLGFRLISVRPKGTNGTCVTARYCGTARELIRFLSYIPSVRLSANSCWGGREILSKGPHVEPGNGYATVISKKFIGNQELCAVGTSTQTLISDGLCSHNSTKTMTALSIIAEAQKLGLVCAYYNIEKRYEPLLAERLGVDTKKLRLVPGSTIETIGDKMESLLSVVHLHVLDSCSMAVSEDELTAGIREWRPALSARAWGKVFHRLNEHFDPVENTAIIINQMRVKGMQTRRGAHMDPEGGKVFDHISSMSVLFEAGKWLYYDEEGVLSDSADKFKGLDDQTVPAGREVKIRIEKSSVCRPFRTATLHFDLDTLQYDRMYEFIKAAKYYGIVRTTSKGRYEYIDDDGEITKMHGDKQLRKFIEGNPSIQEYIHSEVLTAVGIEEDEKRGI